MNPSNVVKLIALGVGLLLQTLSWVSYADQDDEALAAFAEVSPIADVRLPPEARPGSGILLAMEHSEALRNHTWSVVVPRAGRLVVERQRQTISGDGRTVNWMGTVKGAAGGMVSITKRGDVISGFIDDGKRYWVIESAGKGRYRMYELDMSQTPPSEHPLNEGVRDGERLAPMAPLPDGTVVIQDLLIAYSPETKARYGGVAETEVAIENHVAAINQAYANSQVDIQLNLVDTVELAQSQSGNMGTTLSRLTNTTDGYYDEVHALRDESGADLVAMLSTETDGCGIAWITYPYNSRQDTHAFSVTSAYAGYGCLPLTLGHEIGHNQGLCHNREENCRNPAYDYGYGYRVCGVFRTVMSYSCNREPRIYQFANPNITYGGRPTGISHAVDPQNSSEAARALNDAALGLRIIVTVVPQRMYPWFQRWTRSRLFPMRNSMSG